MPIAETSGRIRSERFVNGSSIQQIARDPGLSRNTVRKILRPEETSFVCGREVQLRPKPGRWRAEFDRLLTANTNNSAFERLRLIRLFEELWALDYEGGYDAVRRDALSWAQEHTGQTTTAFVPLSFAPVQSLSVRLEARNHCYEWRHEHSEGRPHAALPQLDVHRARLNGRQEFHLARYLAQGDFRSIFIGAC